MLYMFKDFSGKSRIGEASYRGEGMGQIVLGEIELGERHGPFEYAFLRRKSGV